MEKKFVLVFSLIFLVTSLCSITALTKGTIPMSIGDGTGFVVGDSASFNVTNNSGTTTTDGGTDTGGTGGSGGGGGSGGNGGGSVTTNLNSDFCAENWQCSEWSDCELGIQTRTCTDTHECGTETDKPSTEQQCETTSTTNLFTGFAVGVSDFAKSPTGVATFVIVGLFAVGGITFLAVKGKFKKFLPKKKDNVAEQ
jgi:hypothetical protein